MRLRAFVGVEAGLASAVAVTCLGALIVAGCAPSIERNGIASAALAHDNVSPALTVSAKDKAERDDLPQNHFGCHQCSAVFI